MVSRVYMICNSYESGYGHGLADDGLDLNKTPHADPEQGEAYQIGYEAGRRAGQSSEKYRNLTAEVDNLYRHFPSIKTPNAEVTGVPALSARPVDCRVVRLWGGESES